MDLTTILGLVSGVGLILLALFLGGTIQAFWDFKSLLITFGGTVAATLISFPLRQIIESGRVLRKAFHRGTEDGLEVIARLVRFAEKARREGLLALEDDADQVPDPFLKKGLQLVVDGSDPELIRDILETELSFLEERHKVGARLFETMGALSPAFGMIGTIIGLIQMLRSLADPSTIGSGMATALVTTFYGALAANLVFIPIATKLKGRSQGEMQMKQVMLEGVLSIQAGDNPRIVEEKLRVFLAPRLRKSMIKGASGQATTPAGATAGAAGNPPEGGQ